MQDFDFISHESMKEELIKKRAEDKILNMVLNTLLGADLEDDLPETIKIGSRIMLEINQLRSKTNIFMDIAGPDEDCNQIDGLYSLRKEILEYILLLNAGMDSFLTANGLSAAE